MVQGLLAIYNTPAFIVQAFVVVLSVLAVESFPMRNLVFITLLLLLVVGCKERETGKPSFDDFLKQFPAATLPAKYEVAKLFEQQARAGYSHTLDVEAASLFLNENMGIGSRFYALAFPVAKLGEADGKHILLYGFNGSLGPDAEEELKIAVVDSKGNWLATRRIGYHSAMGGDGGGYETKETVSIKNASTYNVETSIVNYEMEVSGVEDTMSMQRSKPQQYRKSDSETKTILWNGTRFEVRDSVRINGTRVKV